VSSAQQEDDIRKQWVLLPSTLPTSEDTQGAPQGPACHPGYQHMWVKHQSIRMENISGHSEYKISSKNFKHPIETLGGMEIKFFLGLS
jgi:hypothetical protein